MIYERKPIEYIIQARQPKMSMSGNMPLQTYHTLVGDFAGFDKRESHKDV